MKKWYTIRIPKPCHEDWQKMTPNQKGKFCDLCKKTVVDFTNKSKLEIQKFLNQNTTIKVCGHFYKEQLATVNIEIPATIFQKKHAYIRMFALALLLTMGTTLLSCKSDGKIKKIETVEVIDSIIPKTKVIKKDSVLIRKPISSKSKILKPILTKRLILKEKDNLNNLCKKQTDIIEEVIDGEVIISPKITELKTQGDIEVIENNHNTKEIDSILNEIEKIEDLDNDLILGFITTDEKPRFKNSKTKTQREFTEQMAKFVHDNFDLDLCIDLDLKEGKHKINTQFVIDKNGFVKDIKVITPNLYLKKMVIKMIQKLPQFIPGKQRNKPVAVKYNFSINFNIED